LDNYAVDFLRYYAPVDGVEVECGPKIWGTREVIEELKAGLEGNIAQIKFEGDYYDLSEGNEYYVVDHSVSESVNMIYSRAWPTKVDISGPGVDSEVMIAEPVGTQAGLGVLGFCYVPYHFVYDLSFPVLIQVYEGAEIFQFPVAVIVDNNAPREADFADIDYLSLEDEDDFDLCAFYSQDIEVNLFDTNLNSVDGDISYECFNQRCSLGATENGRFRGRAPACYNGFLRVRAEGYQEKAQLFSTSDEIRADIIIAREYEIDVVLEIDSEVFRDGNAVISFTKEDGTTSTAVIPGITTIDLTEGAYEVRVYAYSNTSIAIPASTKTQCQEIPESGILGFLGRTEEECFDITLPATTIDYGLIGGGESSEYITEGMLSNGRVIIGARSLPTPNTVEDLQKNFDSFDTRGVDLVFR